MSTLLLVDDNIELLELFSIFLVRAGHRVITAPGGRECLSLLQAETPDLVVLDVMMEPMDGWDTLGAIKAAASDLPVVMLTGKQACQEELDMYGDLIEDYLRKPLTREELVAALSGVLADLSSVKEVADNAARAGVSPELVQEYVGLRNRAARTARLASALASPNLRVPEMRPGDLARLADLEAVIGEARGQ